MIVSLFWCLFIVLQTIIDYTKICTYIVIFCKIITNGIAVSVIPTLLIPIQDNASAELFLVPEICCISKSYSD